MRKFLTTFPFVGTGLWMLLAALFCWSQSPLGLSIVCSAGGALVGGVLAYLAAGRRFHISKIWIAGLVLMLGVNWLTDVFRWLSLPSLVVGGPGTYVLSDAFFWGLQSVALVFLLRFTSASRPACLFLELLVAGAVMVELFEAHRHGFINRPYALVDPLWARGIDPLPVFLAIGAVVGVLLLVLGASHSPKRGRWIDVVGLVLILGGLFLFAPLEKLRELPQPPEQSESESQDGEQVGNAGQQPSGSSGQAEGAQHGGDGQEPVDGSRGSGGQQPADGAQQSGSGGQQPADGAQQSGTGGQQPADGAQQSGSGGQQPVDGAQQDGTGGQQPADGAQQQDGEGQADSSEEAQSAGQGGNSDSLTFRDGNSSSGQNPPVAVVIFRDDYTPESGMYYFRQNAFSQYNGTKLVADTSGLYDRDVATEFPGAEPVEPDVPPLDPTLFRKLETRVALLTDHAKPFALVSPTQWRAIPNPDAKRFQKAYEVTSQVLDKPIKEILGRRAGDPSWDRTTWDHYTNGPEDPRYEKLLEEILLRFPDANTDDPLIRALMVKLWLEENCIYSLRSRHEGTKDPTASFLFGDRTGYCVFLAHAAVYLYRTAGMPARTGSGYAVEASQRGDGSSLLVPSKSAHSWPEVYIEGLGWVVLDIAPARSLDPPPQQSDPGLQQMLGEMARQDPGEEPPDPVEEKFDLQQALKNLAKTLFNLLPYLLMALVVVAYATKIYRRFEPWIAPEKNLPESTLRSALDLLADAGYRRPEGQPREVFSRELASLSPSFHQLTRAHLRHRLGDPGSASKFPWKKTFFAARSEIKKSVAQVELMKGTLNPISWYWVR